jgi:hypothetical protein
MDLTALHFLDEPIQAVYDAPPAREKTPHGPDGFVWKARTYRVTERLSEWRDYARRGRSARNMRPAHAQVAAQRGSLGVGCFYFRVHAESGQVFDLYYDRAPQDSDRRKGQWYLYREMTHV